VVHEAVSQLSKEQHIESLILENANAVPGILSAEGITEGNLNPEASAIDMEYFVAYDVNGKPERTYTEFGLADNEQVLNFADFEALEAVGIESVRQDLEKFVHGTDQVVVHTSSGHGILGWIGDTAFRDIDTEGLCQLSEELGISNIEELQKITILNSLKLTRKVIPRKWEGGSMCLAACFMSFSLSNGEDPAMALKIMTGAHVAGVDAAMTKYYNTALTCVLRSVVCPDTATLEQLKATHLPTLTVIAEQLGLT